MLAAFVILLTFALFYCILMVDIQQQNKDVIVYLLGVLSAIDTQIIAYYFGSSAGSSKKNDMMEEMMRNGNGQS